MNAANLIEKYDVELLGSENVRYLLSKISYDKHKNIDAELTKKDLIELLVSDRSFLDVPHKTIIRWLNSVYFTNLSNNLPIEFWCVMSKKINELLVLSAILEREKLKKQKDEVIELAELSLCLVEITETLSKIRPQLKEFEQTMYKNKNDAKNYLQYYIM